MGRNLKSQKENIAGFIAAMRTLLDNYPELQRNETLLNLLNSNSPIGFLLNLCEIIGLSKEDLLNWVSKILCGAEAIVNDAGGKVIEGIQGKGERVVDQGILDIIEYSVKTILLTNVKNLFTCSINPLIPYEVLKYPDNRVVRNGGGKGIKISIPTIDMFNVLQHAPNNDYGKTLYFDNNMPSNDYWKSTDFNCFMWYVINKGTTINNEGLKHVWDNRVWQRKKLNENNVFRTNFFDANKGNGVLVSTKTEQGDLDTYQYNEKEKDKEAYKKKKKDGGFIEKKSYLILEYNENDPAVTVPNTLTFYINADRYLREYKKNENGLGIYIPKTIFEFNYDYIFSLKLFDSKVIVANIINSILGIGNSAISSLLNVKYSLHEEAIAKKVGEIVDKIMESEDTIINDDFFSFSNDEYESLLNDTEIKYSENYKFGEVYGTIDENSFNNITEGIMNIGSAPTLNEQQTIIKNLLSNAAKSSANNTEMQIYDKFTLGENIIFDLIKESITQIVLQVLSPKVMLLYAINSYFMGDASDGDFSKINVKNLLKGLNNLIISIVKQVLDILIKELLLYLLTELKDLLNALLRKILFERIEYYIEIIRRLLALIDMFYNAFKRDNNSIIDNVDYADIVQPQKN